MNASVENHPLGATGVWSAALRYGDAAAAAEAAAELESLGYGALWVPDVGGDLFGALENLLEATSTATIATGILNLWMHTPEETAARYNEFVSGFGERLMLGIGVSHAPLANMLKEGQYKKPLARTTEYLDRLDEADPAVPVQHRMLAALGPKFYPPPPPTAHPPSLLVLHQILCFCHKCDLGIVYWGCFSKAA